MRFLFLALSLVISRAAAAEPAVQLGTGSTISLEGDSTLHKYSTKAQAFDATFEMGPAKAGAAPGKGVEALFRSGEVKSVELLIPVAKLKSGEGGLDDNLYKAVRSGEHRNILFHIASYEVLPAKAAGAAFALSIHGELNVGGVSKEIEVVADGFANSKGVRLHGSKDLLMSDYKVEAPVLMLGMLKTKDLITIQFDLNVEESSGAAATKVN